MSNASRDDMSPQNLGSRLAKAECCSRSIAVELGYSRRSGIVASPYSKLRRGVSWKLLQAAIEYSKTYDTIVTSQLLCCPNFYDTPWRTAHYSVQNNYDPRPVQFFLQQVFEGWSANVGATSRDQQNSKHNSWRTPLDALIAIARAVLTSNNIEQHVILAPLLSHSASMETNYNNDVLHTLLETIFAAAPDMLAPVLPTLLPTRLYWRPKDYRAALSSCSSKSTTITDILALAPSTFTGHPRAVSAWWKVLRQRVVEQRPTDRQSLEHGLRRGLERWRPEQLEEWRTWWCTTTEENEQCRENWPEATVLVFLRNALVQSRPDVLVSAFAQLSLAKTRTGKTPKQQQTRAPLKQEDGNDLWEKILSLVGICTNELPEMSQPPINDAYKGGGAFGSSQTLSSIGLLVHQSLFYGCNPKAKRRPDALVLAELWVQAACAAVDSDQSWIAVIVAVLVVNYCEVPMVRSFIMETMQDGEYQANDDSRNRMAIVKTSFVHLIVASNVEATVFPSRHLLQPLESLVFALDDRLPLSLFGPTARSLSQFATARQILFDMLQRSIPRLCLVRSESATEMDGKRALLAGCVLISNSNWDELQCKAWCLLSSIIVENNPLLDCNVRRWLFQQLLGAEASGWVSRTSCRRILSACAARLLQFAGGRPRQAEFDVAKLFATQRDGSVVQIEAMPELFQLVCMSYRCVNRNNQSQCCDMVRVLVRSEQVNIHYDHNASFELIFDAAVVVIFLAFKGTGVEHPNLGQAASIISRRAWEVLKRLESDFFHQIHGATEPAWAAGSLPATTASAFVHTRASLDTEVASVQSSLLNTFLVLLLEVTSSNHNERMKVGRLLDVAVLVGILLDGRPHGCRGCVPSGSPNSIPLSLVAFCKIFSPAIQASLDSPTISIKNLGILLSGVKAVLTSEAFSSQLTTNCTHEKIEAIWTLYQCAGNELAASKIVAAIETCLESLDVQFTVCDVCIQKPSDVDLVVQRLRQAVVDSLLVQMQLMAESDTIPLGSSSWYSRVVIQMCSDLRSGLRGASGGLTHGLFSCKCLPLK